MPAIALFSTLFANGEEIAGQLSTLTGARIVSDKDIIAQAGAKFSLNQNKLEQALYAKMSVFNQFTLEKEMCIASLKSSLADSLAKKEQCIYHGFITLLIPSIRGHILKVLITDSEEQRTLRARGSGLSEKEAKWLIRKNDASAFELSDFLYRKEAGDPSLYDVIIRSAANRTSDPDLKIILDNFHKTCIQQGGDSLQAIRDLAICARVELALINKGHNQQVTAENGTIRLTVNKSVLNYAKLESELTEIAATVRGVKKVEVVKGKDYKISIYRKQQFQFPTRVLLVDDEKEFAQTLSERLTSRDFASQAVHNGRQALDFINETKQDVMILDLKMPGIDGIEVLRQSKKYHPEIEIIILTGQGTEEDRQLCMELGAFAYLEKPADINKLTATIAAAYGKIAAANSSAPPTRQAASGGGG
ncbi:MAG: response regulator [Deltaproteobacteria bacterium]|nr:response regulator [Deltaproteobacteria bacterium]